MADYVPFSSASFPTRPGTINTGVDMGIADQIMRMAQAQQMQHEGVRIDQSRANLERYQGQTPGELAKSNLERILAEMKAQDPNYARETMQGEIGAAQQQQAKGKVAMGTWQSDMDTKNSGNKLEQLGHTIQFMDHHSDIIAAAKASGIPGADQQAYTRMRNALPPEQQAQWPENYGQGVEQGMSKLRERLINSVKQQQTEQAERKKGELHNQGTANVANIQGAWSVKRAEAAAKDRNKSHVQNMMAAAAKGSEQAWNAANSALSDPESDSRTRQMAQEQKDRAEPAYREKLRKTGYDIVGGNIVRFGAPEISQPRAGSPQRATGSIKFGDLAK